MDAALHERGLLAAPSSCPPRRRSPPVQSVLVSGSGALFTMLRRKRPATCRIAGTPRKGQHNKNFGTRACRSAGLPAHIRALPCHVVEDAWLGAFSGMCPPAATITRHSWLHRSSQGDLRPQSRQTPPTPPLSHLQAVAAALLNPPLKGSSGAPPLFSLLKIWCSWAELIAKFVDTLGAPRAQVAPLRRALFYPAKTAS
jgi:hypothetical protein